MACEVVVQRSGLVLFRTDVNSVQEFCEDSLAGDSVYGDYRKVDPWTIELLPKPQHASITGKTYVICRAGVLDVNHR